MTSLIKQDHVRLPSWFVAMIVTIMVSVFTAVFFAGSIYRLVYDNTNRIGIIEQRMYNLEQRCK